MNRSKFERFAKKNGLLLERLENDKRYASLETEWAWRGYCEKASEVPAKKELTPHDIEDYVNGYNDCRQDLMDGHCESLVSQAVAICQEEADEWDSDRLVTHKNYAEHCGERIRQLKDDRVCAICDGGPGNDCSCSCGMQKWEV